MTNKSTHTWVNNLCAICGLGIKTIEQKTDRNKAGIFKLKVYVFRGSQTSFAPKCTNVPTVVIKRTPISIKRKTTGERALNLEIWAERPHVDFVTGFPLPDEPKPAYFMHVLGKGAYPAFRLYKKNIVLGSEATHYQYDFQTTEDDPRFDKLNELKEELKAEYNKKHTPVTETEHGKSNRRISNCHI